MILRSLTILSLKNYTITTSYYHIDWFYYYAVYYGLANDFTDFHSYSNIYGYYDSTWKTYAKISKHTQAEIANFSGLLGRVLTEMRLVKFLILNKRIK